MADEAAPKACTIWIVDSDDEDVVGISHPQEYSGQAAQARAPDECDPPLMTTANKDSQMHPAVHANPDQPEMQPPSEDNFACASQSSSVASSTSQRMSATKEGSKVRPDDAQISQKDLQGGEEGLRLQQQHSPLPLRQLIDHNDLQKKLHPDSISRVHAEQAHYRSCRPNGPSREGTQLDRDPRRYNRHREQHSDALYRALYRHTSPRPQQRQENLRVLPNTSWNPSNSPVEDSHGQQIQPPAKRARLSSGTADPTPMVNPKSAVGPLRKKITQLIAEKAQKQEHRDSLLRETTRWQENSESLQARVTQFMQSWRTRQSERLDQKLARVTAVNLCEGKLPEMHIEATPPTEVRTLQSRLEKCMQGIQNNYNRLHEQQRDLVWLAHQISQLNKQLALATSAPP